MYPSPHFISSYVALSKCSLREPVPGKYGLLLRHWSVQLSYQSGVIFRGTVWCDNFSVEPPEWSSTYDFWKTDEIKLDSFYWCDALCSCDSVDAALERFYL